MKYLENRETDPYFNLALEEYVLKNRRDEDYLLLWRNRPTVVVGRHQNTMEEISREAVEKYGVQVVRRETGGGAVYHDLGNLNFSFITETGDTSELTMEQFVVPVIHALNRLGIPVALSGRNDLMADGRKISGNAQTIYRGRILHHGTLLFDTDLDQAQRILQVQADKFQSKSTKSVRSRIGNLKDLLPKDRLMNIEELKTYLLKEIGAEEDVLDDREFAEIRGLAEKKYRTWEWNFGESPEFEYKNRIRFSGGVLSVGLHVEDGVITGVKFHGDFMAVRPVEEIERVLCGINYKRECVKDALASRDLKGYFGAITKEEVIRCMFS